MKKRKEAEICDILPNCYQNASTYNVYDTKNPFIYSPFDTVKCIKFQKCRKICRVIPISSVNITNWLDQLPEAI